MSRTTRFPRTTSRRLRLASLIACLGLLGFVPAWTAAPDTAVTEDSDVLHDNMKQIKKHLKLVGTFVEDSASREKVLAAITQMEGLLLLSKLEEPSNLSEKPEARRAAHTIAFRKDMIASLIQVLKLEVAVLDGDTEEAAEIIKGPLYSMRSEAHELYQPRDG
jgi:hypothetical protein